MDFTKIPEDRREEVRNFVRGNDVRKLWIVHDQYQLSEYKYTCCNLDGLLSWFRSGLNNGEI